MADLELGARPVTSPPLPAWDSIIHVAPRYRFTRAEYDELRAADREHRPPNLTDEAVAALASRQAYIDAQANSALPEWRKSLVKTLTTLDNIQDQISTVVWLTGPIIDRLGKKAKAAHAVVDETGDAINFMQSIIAGPTPGRSGKNRRALARTANARTKGGVIGALQKGIGWLQKNQGHLLEAAQATDTWFGVGISLGSVFGAIEETYWRTGEQAYYEALTALNVASAALPGMSSEAKAHQLQLADSYAQKGIDAALPPPLQLVDWLAEQVKFTATEGRIYDTVTHALETLAGPSDLTSGDAALIAMASIKQNAQLGAAMPAIDNAIGESAIPNLPMPQPRVRDPISRFLLERAGASFDLQGRPAALWAAPAQTVGEHIDEQLPRYIASDKPWLPPATTSPSSQVVHQLLELSQASTSIALTGNENGIRDVYAPDDQLVFAAIDQAALPPPGTSRADLEAWSRVALAAKAANPDAWARNGLQRITARVFQTSTAPAAASSRSSSQAPSP